jgi:hypothetical protein
MTGHVAGIEERTANNCNFRGMLFVPQTARRPLTPNVSQMGRETVLFILTLFDNSHNERSRYHE